MCIGIPMQVTEKRGMLATAEAKGVRREISLHLMTPEEIAVGDFVIVHVGYAIEKVDPIEAQKTWDLFDEVLAATDTEGAPDA